MAGRKGKYHSHVEPRLQMIKNWCRDGAIESEICKRLGLSVSVFNKYKGTHPGLVEALKTGKEEIDYMVENSLVKRALGYNYKEDHKTTNPDGTIMIKQIIKQIAPDVTAQIFWLKNRRPDTWRDKHDIIIENITIGKPPELEDE